ncbi:MAG: leucine-rich repeat domain-containing protein [Clostridiales bacterium]|nr:leucine-rich repeat domain-containing protein [Clostridiales bacterium]
MPWTIYYAIADGEAAVLRCAGDGAPLALPETIEGCPVTSLGPDCFGGGAWTGERDCLIAAAPEELPPLSRTDSPLTRLTIPETVTSIGDRAFARCSGLKRLTLPANLTHLGARAFQSCGSLERIRLPEGLVDLPDYAFSQCRRLERVTLPTRLETLGSHAFYNCVALKELTLPDTVSFVGGGLFLNCKHLSRLTLPLGINISVLLSDLSDDLDLTVRCPDGVARFFLPGFSYEYEDINAPRMWRTITYGSGQLYRECFSSRDIDFDLYESYFDLARKEETPAVAARIAWYRLRWPYHLGKGREDYLAYAAAHTGELLALLLEQEDTEGLEALLEILPLTGEALEALSGQAERAGNVRFVSRLLEARMGLGGGADREFDL